MGGGGVFLHKFYINTKTGVYLRPPPFLPRVITFVNRQVDTTFLCVGYIALFHILKKLTIVCLFIYLFLLNCMHGDIKKIPIIYYLRC